MALLATITPPKSASRGSPSVSVSTSSPPSTRLNSVKTLEATISA